MTHEVGLKYEGLGCLGFKVLCGMTSQNVTGCSPRLNSESKLSTSHAKSVNPNLYLP